MQIYAVEVAAKEDRGFVSSFTLMTGNFFGLMAACIIYGISYDKTNTGWRVALSITFIPATVMLMYVHVTNLKDTATVDDCESKYLRVMY